MEQNEIFEKQKSFLEKKWNTLKKKQLVQKVRKVLLKTMNFHGDRFKFLQGGGQEQCTSLGE